MGLYLLIGIIPKLELVWTKINVVLIIILNILTTLSFRLQGKDLPSRLKENLTFGEA